MMILEAEQLAAEDKYKKVKERVGNTKRKSKGRCTEEEIEQMILEPKQHADELKKVRERVDKSPSLSSTAKGAEGKGKGKKPRGSVAAFLTAEF